METKITVNGRQLMTVGRFTYLGNTRSQNVNIDYEVPYPKMSILMIRCVCVCVYIYMKIKVRDIGENLKKKSIPFGTKPGNDNY
jgi:hypothetical protein